MLALLLYFVSVLIYAVRWVIVLQRAGVGLRLRDSMAAYLASILVNNITPSARAGGELMRILYAYVKTGAPLVKLLNTVAFERICESIPVIALAFVSISEALLSGNRPLSVLLGSVLIVIATIVGVKYWDRILTIAAKRLGFDDQLDTEASVRRLISNKGLFAATIALSALVWVFDILRLYAAALAVGWKAPLLRFALASVMYLVVGILAITPGGLGIVEGGLTAVFVALGAKPSVALALVMIERLISYGFASLIGLLVVVIGGGPQAWTLLKSRWRRTGFTPR